MEGGTLKKHGDLINLHPFLKEKQEESRLKCTQIWSKLREFSKPVHCDSVDFVLLHINVLQM
jgi:hypothetical protein